MIWRRAAIIIIGICSGAVVSGAVFAFIAIIGIVPRLAQKTSTQEKVIVYEEAIILGGIFGTLSLLFEFTVNIGKPLMAFFGICIGVFYGSLAMSLAETLDVLPIMARRLNIKRGLAAFVICLALGKLMGSLLYFLIPGFHGP